MRKLFNLFIVFVLVCITVLFTSCGEKTFKVGLICLHDESSTYDKNFIDSMYRALDNLGLKRSQLELATGIEENENCYLKAVELAKTCDIVFADSFGHEDFIMKAAKKNENTYFCHSTGIKAHIANLDNYFNAFASIYEGRYLAGIAAGMKLNEMISNNKITPEQAIVGYVGAYPYAEVVSGYTSFYLGMKSVCESVTMKVRYTSKWYDFDNEKTAAESLINKDNCVLISQHADSLGAPNACERLNVPNITYNGTTVNDCPNTYVISSKIDWTPYYEKMISAKMKGEVVSEKDFTGTILTGSVKLDDLGTCAAKDTKAAIDAAIKELNAGNLHVFDINTFTVNGEKITSYYPDLGHETKDINVISDGYFHESVYRSAPYFDLRIDGITELNEK